MRDRTSVRRVRPLLLFLLWIWAACVFLVVDLFWNVDEFDGLRPRATFYRAMRLTAHEMVGERCADPDESLPRAPTVSLSASEILAQAQAPPDRVHALEALCAGPDARDELLSVARDPDETPLVRGTAARLLGRAGDPDALEEFLLPAMPREVREGAILGLAECGSPAAASRALALAAGPSSPERLMAVRSLERFGSPETMHVLAEALADTATDTDVRVSICRGLGAHGGALAVEPLARAAAATSPRPVRIAAIEAMEGMDSPDVLAALREARETTDATVAQRAALALTRAEEKLGRATRKG